MLSKDEEALVQKLVDTRFFGYAQARIGKLPGPVLDRLVQLCSTPKQSCPQTASEKVTRILEAKKELEREAKKQTCAKKAVSTVSASSTPCPGTPAPTPTPTPTPTPQHTPRRAQVFRTAHELNIVAFNTLKLRLDREDLQDDWDAAVLEFSKYDVLLMSEVRASDKLFKARVHRLVEMLNSCTKEEEWIFHHSEPSGPGIKEIHLVLAKKPIRILAVRTLMELDGVSMDHAPFVVTLEDTRFVGELQRVNVVSVHLPPNGKDRRSARDAQIRKLTSLYPADAAARIETPFTDKAAKETRKKQPYVAHILAGDFNADAKELRDLDVERHGWEIVLGSVRTSSGGKAYDNFLINRDCKDHLVLGSDVLDLTQYANFSRGQQGISDHAPIALRLKEVPRREGADRNLA